MQHPIVITGATSGIGRETALFLAAKGFRVIATARDTARGAELVAEGGGRIEIVPLELTDSRSVEECVRTIGQRTGGVAALINNAGTQLRGFFEDVSDEELRKLFDINFFGVASFTRAMIPLIRRTGAGSRIVFVTSVGGLIGTHGLSAYCATKFALEGLAECLRLELAPHGIHVSSVEPGIVNTPIWGKNKLVARAAEQPGSPNYSLFQETEKWGEWALKASPIRPLDVARTIHKAVISRRPRMRYIVGSRPTIFLSMRRYLPGEIVDRILCQTSAGRLRKAMAAVSGK